MDDGAASSSAVVSRVYRRLRERVERTRRLLRRPMTLTEKVLANHLRQPADPKVARGISYVDFEPDRVVLQDALAQVVLLQFMLAGLEETAVPTTVHCDHLVQAKAFAASDLRRALDANEEIYDFLRAACAAYGIGFWEPGSGIIHQVVFEHYAFPGGMMIGTDSHTPNAGGMGMVAVGVGGGDAIDVMSASALNLRWPHVIGVRLTGSLSGWASPKDVILSLTNRLTVRGGTGAVIEYFGPGADTISATGKGTICNMGAETGATTSLFPYDANIAGYLTATRRDAIVEAAAAVAPDLRADPEVDADPERFFDRVIELDLGSVRPTISGPDTPDLAHSVSDVGSWAGANGVPVKISAALIGSCTNSSYEDFTRAASIARQATARGLRARVPLLITPGSEQVRATIERDGVLADLEAIGGNVLANACGPCIGNWDRADLDANQTNTIVNSFNRNFPKRNDGSEATKAFVTSPELVIAYALAGSLDFDPCTSAIVCPDGQEVRLDPPVGSDLPNRGFDAGTPGYVAPPRSSAPTRVMPRVSPISDRLQLLDPFPAWDGDDFVDLPVLLKAEGRCTTDHISPAGVWLKYRGHLENMSGNLFLGAVNAYTHETGRGKDPLDGAIRSFPDIAKHLAAAGVQWCVVGDENYGEGSSREHAAMEPRYRGCRLVIARSFARIHETNLKKQGLLPLTFVDPATHELIGEDDRISVVGLASLAPDRLVLCRLTKRNGTASTFRCAHTFSPDQIAWFEAGSALNVIHRQRQKSLRAESRRKP